MKSRKLSYVGKSQPLKRDAYLTINLDENASNNLPEITISPPTLPLPNIHLELHIDFIKDGVTRTAGTLYLKE